MVLFQGLLLREGIDNPLPQRSIGVECKYLRNKPILVYFDFYIFVDEPASDALFKIMVSAHGHVGEAR